METTKMDRKRMISRFERILGLRFPPSYRDFLQEHGSAMVDGFLILGIPGMRKQELDLEKIKSNAICPLCGKEKLTGKLACQTCYRQYVKEAAAALSGGGEYIELQDWIRDRIPRMGPGKTAAEERGAKELSVVEATEIFRRQRPDLTGKPLAVISLLKRKRVMCLDLERATEEDCFLIDISFNKEEPSFPLNQTFKEWLEIHRAYEKRFKDAYSRVQRRRKETEERRKKKFGGKKGLRPQPKDWRPIVSEIQDYIIGLTALRFNPRFNCLEVDEFYALDLPGYVPGIAIRNLLNIVFTMARDFGGNLAVAFTDERKGDKLSFFQPPAPIPQQIIDFAKECGISFEKAKEGKISHQEGVELFFAILDFPPKAKEAALKLEENNYLTREMIAEIVALGLWSREEVIWLLENASRPEALILGADLPENRVFHADSLNYGRSLILAKRFQAAVLAQITDGFSSPENDLPQCELEPQGNFWVFRTERNFSLPWLKPWLKEEEIQAEQNEPVLIFARPKIVGSKEENRQWMIDNIALVLTEKEKLSVRIACLIINYEFISPDFGQDPEEVKTISKAAREKGVYLLFPYDRCDQLDLEIEEKMSRARRMRHFPCRQVPLALQVIEAPAEEWEYEKPFGHLVRNAYDYGRLVAKKIDNPRYRNDFIITSGAAERMACQEQKNKRIAVLKGAESQAVLEALKQENGIAYSFVRPEDFSQFLGRLEKKALAFKKVQPGIVTATLAAIKVWIQLKKVQGGIVITTLPYQKTEAPLVKFEIVQEKIDLPEAITGKISEKIEQKIKEQSYVSQGAPIRSGHRQVQEALKGGLALAVSYLEPAAFVETLRDYVYYSVFVEEKEEEFLPSLRRKTLQEKRLPEKETGLGIVYNDASEGKPFPLFSLPEGLKPKGKFHRFPAQLVSLRHMAADFATECSIIRNVEIQRREDSGEQEEFAFKKVYFFVDTFLKLIKREIAIEEVEKTAMIFRLLWDYADFAERPIKEIEPQTGLEIHLFQSTGLEPAVVGAYRAAVELLKKYRGSLIVVPRIYKSSEALEKELEATNEFDSQKRQKIVSAMYLSAQEWF